MSNNWIDDELNKKRNSENEKRNSETQTQLFYKKYFEKYLSIKSQIDKVLEYIDKLKELKFEIKFNMYKQENCFSYEFVCHDAQSKIVSERPDEVVIKRRRILIFTFKEKDNEQPAVDVKFYQKVIEEKTKDKYWSDGEYNFYAKTEFNEISDSPKVEMDVVEKIDNNFINEMLTWLCFKNNVFTSYYTTKELPKEYYKSSSEKMSTIFGVTLIGTIISFFLVSIIDGAIYSNSISKIWSHAKYGTLIGGVLTFLIIVIYIKKK